MSIFSIILIFSFLILLISLYYIKNSQSENTDKSKEKRKEKNMPNINKKTGNLVSINPQKGININQITLSTDSQVSSNSLSNTENSKTVSIVKNTDDSHQEKPKEDSNYLTQLKKSNSPSSGEDTPLSDTPLYISIAVTGTGNLKNAKNFNENNEKGLNDIKKQTLKKDDIKRGGLKKHQAKKLLVNSVKISNSKEAEMRRKRLADRLTKAKDKNNMLMNNQLRKSDKNLNNRLNNYKKVLIKNDL